MIFITQYDIIVSPIAEKYSIHSHHPFKKGIPKMIRFIFSFLFMFLLTEGHFRIVNGAIPAAQRNALIDLYNNTGGSNWTNKSNWLGDAGTENTWYGITCDSGNNYITEIDLHTNNLSGELPDSIGDLSNLTVMKLYGNSLTGSIPISIHSLTGLTFLALSDNQLSGAIPTGISSLLNLTYLSLSNNRLTGSIPSGISNLTGLTDLWLDSNQLGSSIPSNIGNLTALRSLALSDNLLNDEIPVSIGSLTNLQYLSLSNNELTGGVPAEIGDLTGLTYLSLSNNQLTGPIPREIGNLENLTILLISNNRLQGQIPEEITLLINLIDDRSDFRYNNFSTTVSDELQTFLDQKQTGGNWETSQGSSGNGTSTPLTQDDDSSCFLRSIFGSTEWENTLGF